MTNKFSHLDNNQPQMVDVGNKEITKRKATARAIVVLGKQIMQQLNNKELMMPKGPVFQTAIIAGTMAAKKTSDLIPLCHPLPINSIKIFIEAISKTSIQIECTVKTEGKTGVEMEALTGANIAALTVYDMCKALSHSIVIEQIKLIEKTGGKSDFALK